MKLDELKLISNYANLAWAYELGPFLSFNLHKAMVWFLASRIPTRSGLSLL